MTDIFARVSSHQSTLPSTSLLRLTALTALTQEHGSVNSITHSELRDKPLTWISSNLESQSKFVCWKQVSTPVQLFIEFALLFPLYNPPVTRSFGINHLDSQKK